MIDPDDVPIYCFSFQNPGRKERLQKRFETLQLKCIFIEPTPRDDPSFQEKYKDSVGHDGNYTVMEDHLRMIRYFYETGKPYGIMCEDDVYLKKTFKQDLPYIIAEVERLKIDILLLGYLLIGRPCSAEERFPLFPGSYTYHYYDDELWGAEMYLLTRAQAKFLLDKYTPEWVILNIAHKAFCSDWTITKEGNRAMIYPMLAVEEGEVKTDHPGQIQYHRDCAAFQYHPDYYI